MDSDIGDNVLLSPALAYVHGACLVFLDALGSGLTSLSSSTSSGGLKYAYQACFEFLRKQVDGEEETIRGSWRPEIDHIGNVKDRADLFGVTPFFIPRGMFYGAICIQTITILKSVLSISKHVAWSIVD